jgi:ATP synthase protein I
VYSTEAVDAWTENLYYRSPRSHRSPFCPETWVKLFEVLLPVGDTIDFGLARISIQTLVESPEQQVIVAFSAEEEPAAVVATPIDNGMDGYQQLKRELFVYIAALALPVFFLVWLKFGLNIALNYLLGAVVGLIYVRMLAQAVERLGTENRRLSPNRLGLFAAVIILATRLPQLHVLPVFLGFLTYKAALMIYAVRMATKPIAPASVPEAIARSAEPDQ